MTSGLEFGIPSIRQRVVVLPIGVHGGLVSELRPGEGRKQKEQHQEDTNPNQADMGKVPNGAWDEWQLLFKTSNILASILLNDSARTERNSGIKPLKSGRRSLASNMHCSQIASLALPI
ncbi:hypothetical protein FRC18_004584 [Serendipita sp. 400]|nr:hypothetical protein FRC18_004584 [Serendipita sp. 400]